MQHRHNSGIATIVRLALVGPAAVVAIVLLLFASTFVPALAGAPSVTVGYQPMVSTGLAAKQLFEAWFVFDKSPDPTVPGYAVPPGATVRFTFPKEFTPLMGKPHLEAALLHGWPHGAIQVPFTITQDEAEPRTVVVRIDQAIAIGPPERPGLKAIHVRTGELNPASPGDYPIAVQFIDAGPMSGTTSAIAHITDKPVPNVAAYNQLHQSRNADWQRVKAGAEAALPIDFLVNLPNESRSSIILAPAGDGAINILGDGKRIGSITTRGAPVTLRPQTFGPGFARLGIIEVHAKAGSQPGTAEIIASLDGGTQYTINLIVE
jgi:hypothetical protein